MKIIAKALDIKYEQAFVLPDRQKINDFKFVQTKIGRADIFAVIIEKIEMMMD